MTSSLSRSSLADHKTTIVALVKDDDVRDMLGTLETLGFYSSRMRAQAAVAGTGSFGDKALRQLIRVELAQLWVVAKFEISKRCSSLLQSKIHSY